MVDKKALAEILNALGNEHSLTIKEARAKIDAEYSLKGEGTKTAPVRDNYISIIAPKVA